MNNLAWQAGKNLKRTVEMSGLRPLDYWIVALWMVAQEAGVDLDTIVTRLIAAKDFAPTPTDKDEIKRQLGY